MSNTSAYFSYDDRNDESCVTFHRGDLFQMLGRFALPPWTDEAGREIGGEIDCARLASEIIEWERQVEIPYPPANLGCATTDELLAELRSRIDVAGLGASRRQTG